MKGDTLGASLCNSFRHHAARPCLGVRAPDSGEFEWHTYGAVQLRASCVGAVLRQQLGAGGMLGIYGHNSLGWLVADLAALFGGLVSVPLHTAMSAEGFVHCARHSGVRCIVCGAAEFEFVAAAVEQLPEVQAVVTFEPLPSEHPAAAAGGWAAAGGRWTEVASLAAVAERGGVLPPAAREPQPREDGEALTIIYTSGSTGWPKGVPAWGGTAQR